MSDEEKLQAALKAHNRLIEEYKRVQQYENLIPNVKLVKIFIFLFSWLGFGKDTQLAFTKWILCFDGALDGLSKDSLREVGNLLKAWLEAEIENAADNQNMDDATLNEVKQLKDELQNRLDNLDSVQDPNKHLASLKSFAQTSLGLAFTYMFRGLMNDTVRQELLKKIDLDPTKVILTKFFIMRIIKFILIRIFGEVAGKNIFSWVAIVENVLEFIIFSGIRGWLSAVVEGIDYFRYVVLLWILDCGGFPVWPMISRGIFISGDQWTGGRMFITLWCHCAKAERDGENISDVTWSEPHQIPFEDGDQTKGKVLGKQSDEEKMEKEFQNADGTTETRLVSQWDVPLRPDGDAIQRCLESHKDCDICEIYAKVEIIQTTGTTKFHVPLSIHRCN